MSDDSKKEGKGIVKILSNYDKELLYQQFKRGDKTLKDIAKDAGISYQTVLKYKDKGNWEDRKLKEANDMLELQAKSNSDVQLVGKDAVASLVKSLFKMAQDLEETVFYDSNTNIPIPMKTIVECLDKLLRLQHFLKTDGKSISEKNVKVQTINWNQLIQQSIEAKKTNPNFNEEDFAKQVIDVAFTDKEDNE